MNRFIILFSIFGWLILINSPAFAQKADKLCQNQYCNTTSDFDSKSAYGLLTEAKWKAIASRYYQSRLRTHFNVDNDLLSLWDVQKLIGFSGTQVNKSQEGNRQYWVWIDRNNPRKKIRATFNYYQLIDLRGSEFDSLSIEIIRAESKRIENN